MAKGEQPGVLLYFELRPALKMLDLEQKGELFEAILDYGQYAVVPDFDNDPLLAMAWAFISPRLDADKERYQRISEERSRAGRKGGVASGEARQKPNEANEANASFVKQTKPTTTPTTTPSPTTSTTPTTKANSNSVSEGGAGEEDESGGLKPAHYDPDVDAEKRRAEMMRRLENYESR